MSIKMDFGYCEDAITFDRLTSLRRSLRSRGFTFNKVSDKALARAIEVYGESPPEGFDVIKWQGPCKEKCPKCMDAYKRFRSGRWYLRGNAACEAAIAKGARPMFLTLVFPDVGYEFTETEEVEAFESLKEALFGAKLAACRLEIAKSMKANPDNYGLDYDPDAVAEQRAASWIAVNARSEFQKRYGKPAIRFKKGSRLQGFIFKKEHVEALSKMSGAFFIEPPRDGEFSIRLGKQARKTALEKPGYGYSRWCLQKFFKRLRKGSYGYPKYAFKYMAFPEEGPNATHRVHFHCVLFCYDADLDLDTFRECCKYHWHAVSGNTRFPEGEHEEKKWFDSVIDSKIVARYVAKYVAKDKLKEARVMASHGFNWSETVMDIVLANRGLVEQPGPENWSAEFEYESPHNRETLSEKVGHTDWVGLELDTISHAIETDSPSGVSVAGQDDRGLYHDCSF